MAGDASINGVIRQPKVEELPQVLKMCARFYKATGYEDIAQLDYESLMLTLVALLQDGVLLVADKDDAIVGIAGAVIYPFYFNRHHKTSQEMFWWVEPEHRGMGKELFLALKQEAKKKGAESLSMIAIELAPWVGEFYEREGMKRSERSYIGRL